LTIDATQLKPENRKPLFVFFVSHYNPCVMILKSKIRTTTIILISLAAITFLISCRSERKDEPVVRRYELKGRVESLDFNGKRLTVAHEAIKGYMEAMTMSFPVADENVLRELKSGDQVQAILIDDSSTSRKWLEDIKVIQK
jgi:Cu/Ag efflux protein CusF